MKSSLSRFSAQWSLCACAALIALGAATSAHAQWKWRDANNRVQYSDLPPPNTVPESAILQRPSGARRAAAAPQFTPAASDTAAAPQAAASGAGADPELEARRKKAEADKAAARKAEEDKANAARAETCKRARSYLQSIEEGQRMARTNDKGEREVFDDKIRAEEGKRARDLIASECK
jgi:hypothetical protein